ncbi:pentatricopeptide repeat domain-containing protein [Colletotrichum orchidophilum]|uniref:Pentatricopeptide repeat domain-containing protein n=1 Tax=Colletotrichum orchidophilum TaxID=1209926 RepID=A0A1G4BBR4_9PEZI|nr:pentatricopeptide repeat domain-containing protein [Colletotrichum orchidophilum]OHE98857.1 pentatricopeptide repeat domain-containing protein [Colletotrichum orchidophilum]
MSHRTLFRDITCRNTFICQSCQSTLGSSAPPPWAIRHSSRVAQLGVRPRPGAQNTQRKSSPTQSARTDADPNKAAADLLKELTQRKTGEPILKFFEKSQSGKVEQLGGEDAFTDSLGGMAELEKELNVNFAADMRRMLSRLQNEGGLGALGINDVESIANDFEGKLGDTKNPEEMMENLDTYIKDLESQLEAAGFDVGEFDDSNPVATMDVIEATAREDPSKRKKNPRIPQIPEKAWSFNQRKRITRLNALLSRTTKEMRRGEDVTAKTAQSVWKTYSAARQSLAKAWAHVPQDVWNLLWDILSLDGAHNPSRLTYLSLLARDMSEAKVALSPSQQLVTVEAMFVDGWEAKAIENWKRCMSTLGDSGADTFKEFWELGVRMFCQQGELVQGERAVNKLLERQLDPRILLPYIRSCAANPKVEARAKAWDAYRRMRDLLGSSMGLEDYDQVISFFLTTGQTEYALQAFVDMMSSGTVQLGGRERLPSQIGNKFFFGKWLKRLIGAGDLDGAHSVFEFMRFKGIEAASIQVNGLIGAWQRSGGANNLERADKLAWNMINARIDFVENRRRLSTMQGPVRTVEVTGNARMAAMPKATLETFSLLAENYRLRNLHGDLAKLWDAFREAEISPDAFMMNQLLESYSQNGNISEARQLYRTLVYERQVNPDPYTFMALWKMLGVNRLHNIAGDELADEVRITRETFAEMVRFSSLFKPDGLDGQLARKILHTFRRLKDKLGLVVALQAFKTVFDFTPPEVLALEMMMETTSLAWETTQARQKLRLVKRKIDAHVESRQKFIGGSLTLDEMTPKQRGEEYSHYLQTSYMHDIGEMPDGHVTQVAKEMGVHEILAGQGA